RDEGRAAGDRGKTDRRRQRGPGRPRGAEALRQHRHRQATWYGTRIPAKISERRNREVGRHPAHHQRHRLGASALCGFAVSSMSKKKIVFQGEPGANSHLAISQAYPDAEAVPCATFEDAFTALSA